MEAEAEDRAAVAKAAAMGEELKGAVNKHDDLGLAAQEAVNDFAAKLAELDALLADSDDESSTVMHLADREKVQAQCESKLPPS
mmetsp:Transcript_84797/g.133962  ORF Transcript_84797/g.133962 Transcript_84797/m.133962 type:complete len:84 (-) Transcript_84797:109-360(-)